jgi:hypothetical protein
MVKIKLWRRRCHEGGFGMGQGKARLLEDQIIETFKKRDATKWKNIT